MRGIGVAVSVRTCSPSARLRSLAFWAVPKRCSSSMTTRPRSLKRTPFAATAWVPITTWMVPSASPSLTRFASPGFTKRDSPATSIPRPAKRRLKVWRCWRASTVVGAATATCLPASAAAAAARRATSVLPNPTSPHTSRSIGRPEARSARASAMARAWSGVSENGKRATNRSKACRRGASFGAVVASRARASSTRWRALSATATATCAWHFGQDSPSRRSSVTVSASEAYRQTLSISSAGIRSLASFA